MKLEKGIGMNREVTKVAKKKEKVL